MSWKSHGIKFLSMSKTLQWIVDISLSKCDIILIFLSKFLYILHQMVTVYIEVYENITLAIISLSKEKITYYFLTMSILPKADYLK